MKVAISGASGFVGRMLVPVLEARGCTVIHVGRRTSRPSRGTDFVSYDQLEGSLTDVDIFVHMATKNNNDDETIDKFRAVNVDLLIQCAEAARGAGVSRFLNVSSIKALDLDDQTPYAVSKREAALALAELEWQQTSTVFAAPIRGNHPPRRLRFLSVLPTRVRKSALNTVSALHPMLSVEVLAEEILAPDRHHIDEYVLADPPAANKTYQTVKRAVDLTFAICVVAFFGWAMALIALAVRLDSKGPAIFRQERVGEMGKTFTIYKFRTMKVGTKAVGTHEMSVVNVTRCGKLLRSFKIDELPQVWNIFRNELSLVGPRPCLPNQDEVLSERAKYGALDSKPGITGLAQVFGIDMSMPTELAKKDAEYKALGSLLLDAKILIATFVGKGSGDHVKAAPASRPAQQGR